MGVWCALSLCLLCAAAVEMRLTVSLIPDFSYTCLPNTTTMAKSKDQKKEVKKVATKTKAEKRAEKRDKKPKYD